MSSSEPYRQAGQSPIQHEGFIRHKNYRYLRIAAIISIFSFLVYLVADVGGRPNGGTWVGYTLGTVSALLIVWLMMLGIRKRAITPGRWSLKAWTSAHIYLGASLLVIATLHTGFQFGINVHTLAYALMVIVILSGFIGLYYYAVTPSKMSDNRAHKSQVEMAQELRDIDRELRDIAQPLAREYADEIDRSISKTKVRPGLFSSLNGEQNNCATSQAMRRLRRQLKSAPSHMRRPLEDALAVLKRKNAALARIRRHIRYKTVLQVWLHFHVPLSFALLAALIAHIVSVFFYW